MINNIHGGVSNSIIYGYAGTTTLKYTVSNEIFEMVLNEKGNVDSFRLDNSDRDYDTFNDDLKNCLDVADRSRNNELIFFIPNNTDFIDRLTKLVTSHPLKEHLTKYRANVLVVKKLINECINDIFTEIQTYFGEIRLRKEIPGNILHIRIGSGRWNQKGHDHFPGIGIL